MQLLEAGLAEGGWGEGGECVVVAEESAVFLLAASAGRLFGGGDEGCEGQRGGRVLASAVDGGEVEGVGAEPEVDEQAAYSKLDGKNEVIRTRS